MTGEAAAPSTGADAPVAGPREEAATSEAAAPPPVSEADWSEEDSSDSHCREARERKDEPRSREAESPDRERGSASYRGRSPRRKGKNKDKDKEKEKEKADKEETTATDLLGSQCAGGTLKDLKLLYSIPLKLGSHRVF